MATTKEILSAFFESYGGLEALAFDQGYGVWELAEDAAESILSRYPDNITFDKICSDVIDKIVRIGYELGQSLEGMDLSEDSKKIWQQNIGFFNILLDIPKDKWDYSKQIHPFAYLEHTYSYLEKEFLKSQTYTIFYVGKRNPFWFKDSQWQVRVDEEDLAAWASKFFHQPIEIRRMMNGQMTDDIYELDEHGEIIYDDENPFGRRIPNPVYYASREQPLKIFEHLSWQQAREWADLLFYQGYDLIVEQELLEPIPA